jgi:hypothetical protein
MIEAKTHFEYQEYSSRIKNLRDDIQEITDKDILKRYESEVSAILKEYPQSIQPRRLELVQMYFHIASKYVNMEISRTYNGDNCCPQCGAPIPDGKVRTCYTCNIEDDADDVVVPVSASESDTELKLCIALQEYSGQPRERPPEHVYERLRVFFSSVKDNTRSPKAMRNALACVGDRKYVKDVPLLCHILWRSPLPDIKAIEKQLRVDFRESSVILESMNTSVELPITYRLFQHLRSRGHMCKLEDFDISPLLVLKYDDIYKQVIDKMGLSFHASTI